MVPWSIVDCADDIDDSLYAFNTLFNKVLDNQKSLGRPVVLT